MATPERLPASKVSQEVWAYVLGYSTDNGIMPTLREIAGNFTNKSTGKKYSRQWAKYCLMELERQGKLKVKPYKLRGIQLI